MSETSVLKDFLDEFSYLNWVRNVDNSTYEVYVYDPYGNTFLVSLDLPKYNNDINSIVVAFRRWIKKPFEFNWDDDNHVWFKIHRAYINVKQIRKNGD